MEAKNYNEVSSLLEELLKTSHVFHRILLKELAALEKSDPDELIQCVAEKQQIVQLMFELEQATRHRFQARSQTSIIQIFQDQIHSSDTFKLQELKILIEECKRLHQIIGITVNNSLELNKRILRVIRPKEMVETYNEKGKIS